MNNNINDGTAGHSKGDWSKPFNGENIEANVALTELAQSAPHDCGDPECPGVVNKRKLEYLPTLQFVHDQNKVDLESAKELIGTLQEEREANKRKLELYDKFQLAINEFANAGLLT